MKLLTWSLTIALVALPVLNDTVSAQAQRRGEGKPRTGEAVERSSPPPAPRSTPAPGTARAPREPGPPSRAGGGEATRGEGRREPVGGARVRERDPGPSAVRRPQSPDGSQTERGYGSPDRARPTGGTTAGRQAGPSYSRPRDGRPIVGQAIVRTVPLPRAPVRTTTAGYGYRDYYPSYYVSDYYRYPYYRGGYAYSWYGGVGLGGFYYDPYWWGYPTYYGYGGYSRYGAYDADYYAETGGLRLKVTPRHAQVFVDGYYVGTVDEFDGVFQRMNLDVGPHNIEIRADGYVPLAFDVRILIAQTITYRGELQRMP